MSKIYYVYRHSGKLNTERLKVVFDRFIRLLKGEQIMDVLIRIGGLNNISLIGLVNIAFAVLFLFLKRVLVQHCIGSNINRRATQVILSIPFVFLKK